MSKDSRSKMCLVVTIIILSCVCNSFQGDYGFDDNVDEEIDMYRNKFRKQEEDREFRNQYESATQQPYTPKSGFHMTRRMWKFVAGAVVAIVAVVIGLIIIFVKRRTAAARNNETRRTTL